jgi:hypothetical protein
VVKQSGSDGFVFTGQGQASKSIVLTADIGMDKGERLLPMAAKQSSPVVRTSTMGGEFN